jgi:hypothetical protein
MDLSPASLVLVFFKLPATERKIEMQLGSEPLTFSGGRKISE